MKVFHKSVAELVKVKKEDNVGPDRCPLPLSIIPNRMGINLVAVDSITWTRQEDDQLVSVTIHFLPKVH